MRHEDLKKYWLAEEHDRLTLGLKPRPHPIGFLHEQDLAAYQRALQAAAKQPFFSLGDQDPTGLTFAEYTARLNQLVSQTEAAYA